MATDELNDKIILVTGAGSGIGRQTAIQLAADGAQVIVADLNEAAGAETVALIGDSASFAYCDVSDHGSVDALIAGVVEKYGRLDVAHNNAGISGALGPLDEVTDEELEEIIAINLKGTYWCMQAEIKVMLEAGKGTIINTASVLGDAANVGQSHYISTKHAVVGMTRAATAEYAGRGIRVNCVLPGPVQTPLMEALDVEQPGFLDELRATIPSGRLARTEDIAYTVAWLASDRADYVHGASIVVDGGMLARL